MFVRGNINAVITKTIILFGKIPERESHVLNWILLICKKFIYSAKIRRTVPNIQGFIKFLKHAFECHQFLLIKNGYVEEFENSWYNLRDVFSDE